MQDHFPAIHITVTWKTCPPTEKNLPSYLGSVRVRPSLEVDDTIGVSGARLCVFFHRPLLHCGHGQVGVFTQLHVRVLRGQAGREANMLPHQPPTAAPWGWTASLLIESTITYLFNSIYLSSNLAQDKQQIKLHINNSTFKLCWVYDTFVITVRYRYSKVK